VAGAVGIAVAAVARAARHRLGLARGLGQPAARQLGAAQGQQPAAGVQPGDAAQLVAVLEHLRQARLQGFLGGRGVGGEVGAQGRQRFLAARQFEAQGLLDPEGIGDQLFLALVALHLARLPGQPQQDQQEQQHQQHRHQPAPGAVRYGARHREWVFHAIT
jgi:hypothetical protein